MRASIQCCLRNNPCASVTAAAPMHHLHPRSNLWQVACWHQRRMHSRPLTTTLKKYAAFIRADKCKSLHLLSMACVNKKSTTVKKASFSSIKEGTSMDQQQQKLRPHSITFLTDVEGDGDYFDRFVHNSEILGFRMRNPSYGQYGPFHAISDDSSYDNDGAGGIRNNEGGMEMDQRMNNCKWNLGEWDEDYFPYDKEVIFLDDDGDDDDSRNNSSNDGTCSMLVYGVSFTFVLFTIFRFVAFLVKPYKN